MKQSGPSQQAKIYLNTLIKMADLGDQHALSANCAFKLHDGFRHKPCISINMECATCLFNNSNYEWAYHKSHTEIRSNLIKHLEKECEQKN